MNRSLFLWTFISMTLAFAQTAVERRPYIRATGNATVKVKPDQARLFVTLVGRGSSAKQATDAVNAQSAGLLAQIQQAFGSKAQGRSVGLGLAPSIANGQVSDTPVFATNMSLEIVLSDLALLGQLIDIVAVARPQEISGIEFSVTDPTTFYAQAGREASQKARIQADALAAGLGGRMGRVLSVQEYGSPVIVSRDYVQSQLVSSYVYSFSATGMRPASTSAASGFEPGLIDVRTSVVVEAELIQ